MKLQSLLSRQWANQRPGGGSIIKKILKITVLFFVADANLGLSQVPLIPPVPPGVTATHVSGEDAQCSLSDTAGNIVWAWGTDAGCEKWMNEAKNKQFTAPEPPSFKITPSNTFQPTLPGELTPEQITQYDKMIPATCDAPSALSDMSDGIPEIIGVGPDAARISKFTTTNRGSRPYPAHPEHCNCFAISASLGATG